MKLSSKQLKLRACGLVLTIILIMLVGLMMIDSPVGRMQEYKSGSSCLILDAEENIIAWRVDAKEQWRHTVKIEDCNSNLLGAVIAAEDKRFYDHVGVDPVALFRACVQNVSSAKRISGASTITMQTIRLLHHKKRTYVNKLFEVAKALKLERDASKQEILEAYLNLAPFGGNIVGAEAASRRYFGKHVSELSLGEAALLAGIPQRPAAFNPRKNLSAALERREFVFSRMFELKMITKEEIEIAKREPIELISPVKFPHVDYLAQSIISLYGKDGGVLKTTIQPRCMLRVRSVINKNIRLLTSKGIDGIGVVVVDSKTGALIAAGSDHVARRQSNWVDTTKVRRQPGSLLKPFIWAMSYEQGMTSPDSILYDVPMTWDNYSPKNFDKTFLGPIFAGEALRMSRNIPAIYLLEKIGVQSFTQTLSQVGLNLENDSGAYGLSLALGTAEMNLMDLTSAYSSIARLGKYTPLQILKEHKPTYKQVFSEGAAYLTLQSLGASDPNEDFLPAYKTGTSWNFRDAWAICMTPNYTIGVWCGRFSGKGNDSLVGSQAALPIAIDLVEELRNVNKGIAWEPPSIIAKRHVCSLSGESKNSACPQLKEIKYIRGVGDFLPCKLHKYDQVEKRVFVNWPSEVSTFLSTKDQVGDSQLGNIHIVFPRNRGVYVLNKEKGFVSDHLRLELSSATEAKKEIFWYLNGELLTKGTATGVIPWEMKLGEHTLIASDESGRSHKIQFKVIKK